jgi:hypothetical protein
MLTPEQRKEFLATLDSQRKDFISGFQAKTNFPEDLLRIFCLGGALYEMHMLKLLGFENEELDISNTQVKTNEDGNSVSINVQE